MSNFTDVAQLNEVWGNAAGDQANPDWARAERQLKLIREEVDELINGIETRDMNELKDGALDTLVVTYGLLHIMGVDADAGMREVARSNQSKICLNIVEVGDTMSYYLDDLGVVTKYRESGELGYTVYSAYNQTGNDGKAYPEGKVLKNVNWSVPDLSNC